MKNILLLTTGGTIACQPGAGGLEPKGAMTKLMWVLGQGMTQAKIAQSFSRSLAGEITI